MWSQMTSLWNTRCHLDILRNCVTDSYFLDSPRQIRSQPHASCGIDTPRHLIQQQLMTHAIKSRCTVLQNDRWYAIGAGTLVDIQILQNLFCELKCVKRWVIRHVFWARIRRHLGIIGILCSLYKFCKQITDFLGARGQTTFKCITDGYPKKAFGSLLIASSILRGNHPMC
jgi:hypothetical protein